MGCTFSELSSDVSKFWLNLNTPKIRGMQRELSR